MANPTPPQPKPNSLPNVYAIEEVLNLFPGSLRPTKKVLEEAAIEYGCYRDIFGKKGFTDTDVEELFEHLRAKPTAAAALIKLGPGRLFALDVPKNTPGYMVFIGDQLGEDTTVWIGFAPMDGVTDLLRLVQMGNPGNLAILTFCPATPADVQAHLKTLAQWKYRTDDTNWYMRSTFVNSYIQKLRDSLYGPRPNETDEDASTLSTGE